MQSDNNKQAEVTTCSDSSRESDLPNDNQLNENGNVSTKKIIRDVGIAVLAAKSPSAAIALSGIAALQDQKEAKKAQKKTYKKLKKANAKKRKGRGV